MLHVPFRIRCSPYRNKLTSFEIMFGLPPPLIPTKGRVQAIEMSNYSLLKSLQVLQQIAQDIQSRLLPPLPVTFLTESAHKFQLGDLWVCHLPTQHWNLPLKNHNLWSWPCPLLLRRQGQMLGLIKAETPSQDKNEKWSTTRGLQCPLNVQFTSPWIQTDVNNQDHIQ